MRTGLFLLAGVLVLAGFSIVAKLFSAQLPGATNTAFVAFVALWLAVAAGNMWLGVARAGYSVAEELPIFLLIFGVPAVVAAIVKWKLV